MDSLEGTNQPGAQTGQTRIETESERCPSDHESFHQSYVQSFIDLICSHEIRDPTTGQEVHLERSSTTKGVTTTRGSHRYRIFSTILLQVAFNPYLLMVTDTISWNFVRNSLPRLVSTLRAKLKNALLKHQPIASKGR